MANPQNKKQGKNGSVPAGKLWTTLTGVYLIVLVVFLFYLLFAFWPSPSNPAATPPPKEGTQLTDALTDVDILWWTAKISFEKRLIFLVIIAGALGSYVAAAVSFVDYAGNKKLKRSWLWWYYLRPFTGSVLAVMFYMIIKGGLISASFDAQSLSRFGIVGFAGLVGLFSKQAIDKLNEIFNVVFTLRDEDVK